MEVLRSSLQSDVEERKTLDISKAASFHILEDLEEDSKYRLTLTPVWKGQGKDIQDEIFGNVLTFSLDNTEKGEI